MFLSSPLLAHEGRPAQACLRTVPTFHTPGFEAAHLSYTYIQQQSTNSTSHTHPSQLLRVFKHDCSAGHLISPIIRPHRWQSQLRSVTTQKARGALHWTPSPHSPPCQSQPRTFTTLFHDKHCRLGRAREVYGARRGGGRRSRSRSQHEACIPGRV